jgi:dihydrofolate reductase
MTAAHRRPELVLIAALASNRVIGRGGALPWHLPQDMAHLRATTTGHAVLMGRKTWDSLPQRFRPLPGRRNLVLTRQPGWRAEGAETVASVDEALRRLAGTQRLFVLGGAEVYALALPLADTLILTEIDAAFDGDATFPPLTADFAAVAREPHVAAAPNDFTFAFVTYRRGGTGV